MDLDRLRLTLRRECSVEPSDLVLLGFSGGPDSLALLHVLRSLDQPLIAAHLDHSLRPGSALDAENAASAARAMDVPFVSERADVAGFASHNKLSIEEAARHLRYQFLFRVAAENKASAVVVAHNADDQVETVLMHLLRGAGPEGLRGMAYRALPNAWSDAIPLVRPLLGVWRSEIEEYCGANNLQPIVDPSNRDTTFFRNRLRHELVPLMESYVPGFKQRLTQTASLIGDQVTLMGELVPKAWRRVLSRRGEGYVQLDRRGWLGEHPAMQSAILRRALAELRPQQRDLDYDAVQRARGLIEVSGATAPQDWLAGLCLLVEGDRIWIADWDVDLPIDWPQAPEAPIHAQVPFDLDLGRGWRLRTAVAELRSTGAGENLARLDLDAAGEELTIRRRRPGDRFQPLGMEPGTLKISDFMINEKMPQRARETWPLVCKGDEIVWVPGFRLAHPYRVTDRTERVLEIELAKERL